MSRDTSNDIKKTREMEKATVKMNVIPVFVEMDETKKLQTAEIMFNEAVLNRLAIYGDTIFERSQLYMMLTDSELRRDLIKRWDIILKNFQLSEEKIMPDEYIVHTKEKINEKGEKSTVIDYLEPTELLPYLRGWSRQGGITFQMEGNNYLQTRAKTRTKMNQPKYKVARRSQGYENTIRKIKMLRELVEKIEKKVRTEKEKVNIDNKPDDILMELVTESGGDLEPELSNQIGEYLRKIWDNPVLRSYIPYKRVRDVAIFPNTTRMKKLETFLDDDNTVLLADTVVDGGFNDKFFEGDTIRYILNQIIGENNHTFITSYTNAIDPIMITSEKDKGSLLSARVIYFDVLGNIGIGQVDTHPNWGQGYNGDKTVVMLALRQAMIKAFPMFDSLKYKDNTEDPEPRDRRTKAVGIFRERAHTIKNYILTKGGIDTTRMKLVSNNGKPLDDLNLSNMNLMITQGESTKEEKIPKIPINKEEIRVEIKEKKEAKPIQVEEPDETPMEEEKIN